MGASLSECRLWSTWPKPPDGGRLICCLLCISQSKSIWNHSQIGSDRWWSSQADLSACSQKSALLRSRRSVLPCEWFLFWFSFVKYKINMHCHLFSNSRKEFVKSANSDYRNVKAFESRCCKCCKCKRFTIIWGTNNYWLLVYRFWGVRVLIMECIVFYIHTN